MTGTRESFLLPAIKCSICNADVAISEMGDHVCAPAEEEKASLKGNASRWKTAVRSIKPLKIPQPGTGISSRSFFGREQLTPSSSTSGSRTHSPTTPRDGHPLHTPMGNVPLSEKTYNRNQQKSSSPSLYNLDSTFPSPNSPRDTAPQISPLFYPKESLFGPPSPTSTGSKSVMAKLNGIAPGPFAVGSGGVGKLNQPEILPAIAASFPARNSSRRPSVEPLPAVAATFSRPEERDNRATYGLDTYGTIKFGFEDFRISGGNHTVIEEEETPILPSPRLTERAKVPKPLGLDMPRERRDEVGDEPIPMLPSLGFEFNPRREDTAKSPKGYGFSRAETAPMPPKLNTNTQVLDRSRTVQNKLGVSYDSRIPHTSKKPPHPGLGLPRSPSVTVKNHLKQKISLSKALPPPPISPPIPFESKRLGDKIVGASYNRTRSPSPARPKSPPNVKRPPIRTATPPKQNSYVDYSFQNPHGSGYHIGTLSMSSNASTAFSGFSELSGSSMSSPPSSEISLASKTSGPRFVDSKTSDYSQYKRHESRPSRTANEIDNLMSDLHKSMDNLTTSLPKNELSRKDINNDYHPRVPGQMESLQISTAQDVHDNSQPLHDDLRNRFPIPGQPRNNQPTRALKSEEHVRSKTQGKGHRRTPTSKGPCRGCGEIIIGKSISSADGRLTGRYHKQCFVCQDCREPFQSAEFYVLNNLPFCHRDYHRLNSSLCRMCDRGIEGACLETERKERFHPGCFTCFHCRSVLGEDYFEINGRPFCCERHAHAYLQRARGGPGPARNGNMMQPHTRVERRKTRLMFMEDGVPPSPVPSAKDGPYGVAFPTIY
ncbi:hypothetical protein EDC01DRAFT_85297 [Geopyxis carbonaria]|nr:hypothetical protein EDC01DRAFT_85297 [Geopyxis carbonaria]